MNNYLLKDSILLKHNHSKQSMWAEIDSISKWVYNLAMNDMYITLLMQFQIIKIDFKTMGMNQLN